MIVRSSPFSFVRCLSDPPNLGPAAPKSSPRQPELASSRLNRRMLDGLKARIFFAHSIPYNPSARAVVLFATLGSVYGVLNLFPWFQSRLWLGAAVCFKGVAVLLFLRRSVWKRVLTIADDSCVVPIGCLRMRPTRLMFMSIRHVWVTNLCGTLILRIRTTERDIEIQDMYLPDPRMIWDLKRILECTVANRNAEIRVGSLLPARRTEGRSLSGRRHSSHLRGSRREPRAFYLYTRQQGIWP